MDKEAAFQTVEGALLGDAGLVRRSKNPYFWIDLSGPEHLDWLYALKSALLVLGVSVSSRCPKTVPRVSKLGDKVREWVCIELWSEYSPVLLPLYYRWYPLGKKVLPHDVVLTPVVLANWFMGDGTSFKMPGRQNLVRAKFCTQGFPFCDTDMLKEQLSQLGVVTQRYKSDRSLFVNDAVSITRLMTMIEPHVLPSYRHKIKYPRLVASPRGPKEC